jgi:hypothetical protein
MSREPEMFDRRGIELPEPDEMTLTLQSLVARRLEITFAEFKRRPAGKAHKELEDAMLAFMLFDKLDGLQLEKLYGETPVRLVCEQIAEWVRPR